MRLEVHNNLEEKMQKSIKVLKEELVSIRAGRANPALLDRIEVEYYGSKMPLKQIANISAPEPRLLVIQPYDASSISSIEKAIEQSDLGINPSNDGKVIRLSIPMLTEERRKELLKIVKKTGEEAKVAIRNERREANDKLKKMHKNNELTEDDLKRAEDEVQKLTDKYISIIDELVSKKEKEIMEV
ncbi:ribosome recycling factor [Caminicella sporogenes DSM 14501]|uniref:Ribosome-recycling factor n=1 Tax=Caminicella sporogenes DSM 14501 TaxID=1121266 RepID=A0A1M6L9H5_9FIRM|nr:ribosome recycling factor [Caminicella sporogenes]RKD27753.1 ribosome recycling factor [Caminicella sporogenes]SHJ67836.1 ribosome recycling factor [Caminicella sporogenes DSM 14501]